MRAATFPDSEHVATRWLDSRPEIDATVGTDLVGWRAGQRRVTIARIGGTPPLAIRIDNPRLDVAVYAESKAAAHDLAQRARTALHELPTGDHTDLGAVVCNVVDDVGLAWIPDPDTNAARYIMTLRLVVRPHP